MRGMYRISVMIRIQTRKHDDAMQKNSRREGRKNDTMTSSYNVTKCIKNNNIEQRGSLAIGQILSGTGFVGNIYKDDILTVF
jgi:hypothetical protein